MWATSHKPAAPADRGTPDPPDALLPLRETRSTGRAPVDLHNVSLAPESQPEPPLVYQFADGGHDCPRVGQLLGIDLEHQPAERSAVRDRRRAPRHARPE